MARTPPNFEHGAQLLERHRTEIRDVHVAVRAVCHKVQATAGGEVARLFDALANLCAHFANEYDKEFVRLIDGKELPTDWNLRTGLDWSAAFAKKEPARQQVLDLMNHLKDTIVIWAEDCGVFQDVPSDVRRRVQTSLGLMVANKVISPPPELADLPDAVRAEVLAMTSTSPERDRSR